MRFRSVAGLLAALPAQAMAQDVPPPETARTSIAPQDGEASGEPVPTRGSENAIRQAKDAFGFSSGKETLGLYTTSNVRGFSPVTAGNVQIDGLYFDQVFGLTNRVRESTSIRVGLSASGIPFPAPTGIVDYKLYKPGGTRTGTALVSLNSYGTVTVETDWVIPLDGDRLSVGAGVFHAMEETDDGTSNTRSIQGVSLRWAPSPSVELLPFWTRSKISDDQRAPRYITAGPYLPPPVPTRQYNGPEWATYESTGVAYGLVSDVTPTSSWRIRLGLFRSQLDNDSDYAQLFRDVQPDGSARRFLIADPPTQTGSTSGELRISKISVEGPREHIVHLSLRGRSRNAVYGGAQTIDYGPVHIHDIFDRPKPSFTFGPQSRDRVKQWTGGVAYEGRWEGVGALNVGIAKSDYRKTVALPGLSPIASQAQPWLYYGMLIGQLSSSLTVYASHTKGLEESGVAPDNAANRNEPLPAILTTQSEIGLRYALTPGLGLVAGAFELRKPYYNLNRLDHFALLGDVRNRGIELSLAGAVTPNLNVVAGAVLLDPEVTGEGVTLGRVGPRPIGLPKQTVMGNLDWRPHITPGLSFDLAVTYNSAIMATRDNLVSIPARTLVDLGSRYRFRVAGRGATLRVKMTNLTSEKGFKLQGAGAFDVIEGRLLTAYLSMDL